MNRFKWAVVVVAAFALAVLIYAAGKATAQASAAKVVRAQKFELVDSEGKERASLALLPDGSSGLALAARDGKVRGMLALKPDGTSGLALGDRDGKLIWSAP